MPVLQTSQLCLGRSSVRSLPRLTSGKVHLQFYLLDIFIGLRGISEEIVWLFMFVVGAAVMLGHIFPFFMKFNGGKGTATVIGILLAIDWRFGVIGLGLFILVSLVTILPRIRSTHALC